MLPLPSGKHASNLRETRSSLSQITVTKVEVVAITACLTQAVNMLLPLPSG